MTPEDMLFLAGVVKPRSGLVLAADKGYLVQSRLGPVARRDGSRPSTTWWPR
jgi:chemotaxis protein methyltransferase CheR